MTNVRELLLERATKHADKSVRIELKKMFTKEKNVRLALLINERMVDFPAQIAGPAFKSMMFVLYRNFALVESCWFLGFFFGFFNFNFYNCIIQIIIM